MKIAVFLPNWVGDVVMATPAVRALHQRFPTAELIGVCKPYVSGVIEGAPWFRRLVFLDGKGPWLQRWPSAAAALWRENIDIAVLFPNNFRSGLIAWLAGCRRRIGFERYARGPLLSDRLLPARDPSGKFRPTPIIDDYNRLVEKLGCSAPGHRMELFTTAGDEERAAGVWQRFGLHGYSQVICLNPGAAFGAAKHWPSTNFAEAARRLTTQRDCAVLVLCGPSERHIAREIVELADVPGVFSLADEKLSLGLTKALIRRADLLVTTDSGPRHFAGAFDVPVVTLFGPTHIEWTETYSTRAIHLQKEVPCGPCQLRVCPLDHRCMTALSPSDVCGAVDRLLRGPVPVVLQRKAS